MSTMIIRAKKKKDYIIDGIVRLGYKLETPYTDRNLFLRLCREFWFRFHLPRKDIWYNKKILQTEADTIVIKDPLIVPDYLKWVCNAFPEKKIILEYNNRVSFSSIKPTDVTSDNLEFISYDGDDCRKYGMRQTHPGYMDVYGFSPSDKEKPTYDIVYLGRDKGRAEKLLELQKQLNSFGLNTCFRVCADRSYLRFTKRIYQSEMAYEDYLKLLMKSKAHLNYVQEGQTSVTQRDLESVFYQVKCITNNKGIKDFELYDPSRFFVLGEDDINTIKAFLNSPFLPVDAEKLNEYRAR